MRRHARNRHTSLRLVAEAIVGVGLRSERRQPKGTDQFGSAAPTGATRSKFDEAHLARAGPDRLGRVLSEGALPDA